MLESIDWRIAVEAVEDQVTKLHCAVLIHNQYIDKYDALSLANLDIDPNGLVVGELPQLSSLRILCRLLSDALNRGHISQQSLFASIQSIIAQISQKLSLENPTDDDISANFRSVQSMEVKKSLQDIYISISSLSEAKLSLFRCIQEIFAHYEERLVDLAETNGVLYAAVKYQVVSTDLVQSVLSHKFFTTQEEHSILSSTRNSWGRLVLSGNVSEELSDKDLQRLARREKYTGTEKWLALQLGACAVLLVWTISECFNNESSSYRVWNDPTFAIFMCIGDFILLQLMWGISMVVWRRAGIDFVHLLQLQHTSVGQSKSPATIAIQSATRNSLIFLVVFIIFNKSIHFALRHGYSMTFAHSLPVLLTIYFLWSAFHPWKSRKVWWEMLARVLMAPACPVIFRDGFIGDILTSLVRVLIPFAFSLLYLLLSVYAWVVNDLSWTVSMSDKWWTTNPILHFVLIPFLTIYPLWIRLLQCLRRSVESGHRWPHLANASKYASAIIVISLATFRPEYRGNWLWVLALVGATLFQYSWDLTQDWGMLCFSVPETKENCSFADVSLSFRAKRLLGPSWVYVSVMITNLALRFAWTLTLLPPPNEEDGLTVYNLVTKHVGPILAAAEIVRRMVWGFFRLEFEQIEFLQRANPAKDMDLLDIEMTPMAIDSASPKGRATDDVDWVGLLLPSSMIAAMNSWTCIESWPSKLRLVESIMFAFAVMAIVYVGAQ